MNGTINEMSQWVTYSVAGSPAQAGWAAILGGLSLNFWAGPALWQPKLLVEGQIWKWTVDCDYLNNHTNPTPHASSTTITGIPPRPVKALWAFTALCLSSSSLMQGPPTGKSTPQLLMQRHGTYNYSKHEQGGWQWARHWDQIQCPPIPPPCIDNKQRTDKPSPYPTPISTTHSCPHNTCHCQTTWYLCLCIPTATHTQTWCQTSWQSPTTQ